jgi:GxxExxY protein
MTHNPIPAETDTIAAQIVDAAFKVHTELGPGLLENVYGLCLVHEFAKRRINCKRQMIVPIFYDNIRLDADLRLDLLVENSVIVELKAIDQILPVHKAKS